MKVLKAIEITRLMPVLQFQNVISAPLAKHRLPIQKLSQKTDIQVVETEPRSYPFLKLQEFSFS